MLLQQASQLQQQYAHSDRSHQTLDAQSQIATSSKADERRQAEVTKDELLAQYRVDLKRRKAAKRAEIKQRALDRKLLALKEAANSSACKLPPLKDAPALPDEGSGDLVATSEEALPAPAPAIIPSEYSKSDVSTDAAKLELLYQLISKASHRNIVLSNDPGERFAMAREIMEAPHKWLDPVPPVPTIAKKVSFEAAKDELPSSSVADPGSKTTGLVEVRSGGRRCCRKRPACCSNTAGLALFVVLAWVWSATAFYYFYVRHWTKNHNETASLDEKKTSWSLAMCFYYSVQAGFSIGYGKLVEVDDWQKLYTLFHVFVGTTMISAALSIFSQFIMESAEKLRDEVHDKMMHITDHEFHILQKKRDTRKKRRGFCPGFLSFGFLRRLSASVDFQLEIGVLLVWLVMGAYYAASKWDTSYVEAAYFAVTSLSTGGLLAPVKTDDESMWVTGVFGLVGVPLFGVVVGRAASLLVHPDIERKFQEKFELASKLDVGSFLEATQSGDEFLTYGEYLEFCLKRAYEAKDNQIFQLRSRFRAMDLSSDGKISRSEAERWVKSRQQHTEKQEQA